MNVLSLFDGMSCGQIALDELGVDVKNYYASEIDKHAIKVTQSNYSKTVQLGDVTKLNAKDLPEIELLMGGSPCQGFSFAGKQLNFKDERSKLFFEFVRIMDEVKPKYFLLENVRMSKKSQDVISHYLGVEPVMINSSNFTAQNRVRYYWTNIPISEYKDLEVTLESVVGQPCVGASRRGRYISGKSGKTIQKEELRKDLKANSMTTVSKNCMVKIKSTGELRNLNRNEAEKLQSIPINYTDSVSLSQSLKMLGNGWTVSVIKHILKNLK